MTPDTQEILGGLLLSTRLSELEAMTLQAMMRKALQNEHDMDRQLSQKLIAESDRDNRRRRMDIAMVILDDTCVTDLDAIAAIIWPAEDVPQNFRRGTKTATFPASSLSDMEASGVPVESDPTQMPSHLPQPGDKFVSWDCLTMGHRWGDVVAHEGTGMRTCLACGDERVL